MTIAVRPAGPADRERLVAWCQAFFAHLKAATADPFLEGAEKPRDASAGRVDELLLAGEGPVLVAELGGEPVGFLAGWAEPPFASESPIPLVGHVSLVWVEPAARGRGVARALVAAAEAAFRERGIGWVQLGYQPANRSAAAAWTALGFEPFFVRARRRL